jgi:hypothetical protein
MRMLIQPPNVWFLGVISDPSRETNGSQTATGTIAGVVLTAFLVGLVLVLAATAFAVLRAIGLWRQAKRTGGTLRGEVASFEERAARAERHMSQWERSSGELELALARLRVSQARLRILLDAVDRAESRIHWIRAFVPR